MVSIDILRALASATNSLRYNPEIDPDTAAAYEQILVNLRDELCQEKAETPNVPLTLEELREMGADMYSPVWIECKRSQMYNWTGYDLIIVHNELIISALDRLLSIRDYGDSWLAYRSKPEEGDS